MMNINKNKIRKARFAGSFYPDDPDELKISVLKYADNCVINFEKRPKILIVPHAGYVYSGAVAGCGYKQINPYKYKNIFMLGPSHKIYVKNIGLSTCPIWWTPLGNMEVNMDISQKLATKKGFDFTDEAHEYEHSVEVQLPFIQSLHPDVQIIPMVSSEITELNSIVDNLSNIITEDDLLIISTDLSHYLPADVAKKKDRKTIDKVLDFELDFENDSACGVAGLQIAVQLAKINEYKPKLVKYMHSGEMSGDMGSVVGYVSIVFNLL